MTEQEKKKKEINIPTQLEMMNQIYEHAEHTIMQNSLSIMARRFLAALASQINPGDEEFVEEKMKSDSIFMYKINAKKFCELFGYNTNKLHTRIAYALEELCDIKFNFKTKKFGRGSSIGTRLVLLYRRRAGDIYIGVDPFILPFYLNKGAQYTLANVLSFQYVYTYVFYEKFMHELKNHKSLTLEMTIEEIRDMLNLKDKFPLYKDLKKNIIEKMKEDINKNDEHNYCNINVEYEEIKGNRKVESLRFLINKKQQKIIPVINLDDTYSKLSHDGQIAYDFFRLQGNQGVAFLNEKLEELGEDYFIELYKYIKSKNDIKSTPAYARKGLEKKWLINKDNNKSDPMPKIALPKDLGENTDAAQSALMLQSILQKPKTEQQEIFEQVIVYIKYNNNPYYKIITNLTYDEILNSNGAKSLYSKALYEYANKDK